MGVPEVWWWRRGGLEVLVLGKDQKYAPSTSSVFPQIPLDEVRRHIEMGRQMSKAGQARAAFRRWLRGYLSERESPGDQPPVSE